MKDLVLSEEILKEIERCVGERFAPSGKTFTLAESKNVNAEINPATGNMTITARSKFFYSDLTVISAHWRVLVDVWVERSPDDVELIGELKVFTPGDTVPATNVPSSS